ncbi:MAG: hypothetical protein FJ405_08185 [Verrucomicrobia bacterium]|nr:hypothetical protein [Verrucomicrobiota bacterium]
MTHREMHESHDDCRQEAWSGERDRKPMSSVLLLVLCLTFGGKCMAAPHVHDLSLLVSPTLPSVWPVGMMQHSVTPNRTFGPGAYHRDLIAIDEHTGTQWDAPAHFVPPPDSGLPGAGPMGLITSEKVPAWQFCGEACVIDVSAQCDTATNGGSFLITPDVVKAWERSHRPLRFGDAVLFRSDYSDRYYKPFPKGERFVQTALRQQTPGWPAPTADTMRYLGGLGVRMLGIDGASMGPLPNLAVATHQAGGQLGMIWTECLTGLSKLPTTGSFHAFLPAKHAGGSGGECRAIGITEPTLAARLIANAKNKRVIDVSVTLDEDLPITWPGHGPGDEAPRYIAKTLNPFSRIRGPYFARTHLLDGLVGTHVVPPSFSLPPAGFQASGYSAEVQGVLKDYEKQFGKRGVSDLTMEKLPLEQMMGEVHLVDTASLMGTTAQKDWPASPMVTADFLKKHESAGRRFRAGEIVLFRSGYTDQHFAPLPDQPQPDRLIAAPLAGTAEGWPGISAEAIAYLAERGIRCFGTDTPTMGGVDPKQALRSNWIAASRGMLPVEFLINLKQVPSSGSYFIFAPIKIQGARGGYGRAIVLHDTGSPSSQ